MTDLIDRQTIIDTIHSAIYPYFCGAEDGDALSEDEKLVLSVNKAVCTAIKALPSAEPEPIRLRIDHELSKEEFERLKKDFAEQPIILFPKESAQPGWIPVSERLPEDLVGVLVDDDGTTAIGYCEHYWDDDGKTHVEWHDLLHYRIEPHYWMPLPEPYKDGD